MSNKQWTIGLVNGTMKRLRSGEDPQDIAKDLGCSYNALRGQVRNWVHNLVYNWNQVKELAHGKETDPRRSTSGPGLRNAGRFVRLHGVFGMQVF